MCKSVLIGVQVMFSFDHEAFKMALKKVEDDNHQLLMEEVEKVKAFVEKALSLGLESTASMSRTNYPGLEL